MLTSDWCFNNVFYGRLIKRGAEQERCWVGLRRAGSDMDVHHHHHHPHHEAVEFEFQFWPIEHPVEPQDDDRPVRCPIPNSAAFNDGEKQDESYVESARKRSELGREKESIVTRSPDRAVRKRHHADPLIIPSTTTTTTTTSPRPSMSAQNNITIFKMLQDFQH